jgi:hypothetical protein
VRPGSEASAVSEPGILLNPGSPIATLTISGSYTQTPTGLMNIRRKSRESARPKPDTRFLNRPAPRPTTGG